MKTEEREMISLEKAIQMFERMVRIRLFDEKGLELAMKGILPGHLHPSIGQEAVSVGACAALRDDDYMISTHRGHGDIIAKGASTDKMMAELLAKRGGYCKGKGGSLHIADLDLGILGATGIVGGGLPIADGAALACQLKGTDQVSLCFFGDGASDTGSFHEALNMAAVWSLPVIFVCHNNLYAMSTPQRDHQKIRNISIRSEGYGMPGMTVDGNDVFVVYKAASTAVERARSGAGPTLIECKTYRFLGHYTGDPSGSYRTKQEVDEWKKRDPIVVYRAKLFAMGLANEDELIEIEQKVAKEIEEAVVFAQNSPDPTPGEAFEDIYVGEFIP
jgi:TPP-dependent pyruvate/acetoin dehydrogenase alpha subunit